MIATHQISSKLRTKLSTPDIAPDIAFNAAIVARDTLNECHADSVEELKAWLRQLLMLQVMDQYRNLQKANPEKSGVTESVANNNLELPSHRVDHQEDEARLMAAMNLLSASDRQLIEMRHRDGETFAEIGKKLNQSADAIQVAWNQAIEKLAKILHREQ